VPVTVIEYVPAGVPGLPVLPPPPPPPPPHAPKAKVSNIPMPKATSAGRTWLALGRAQVRTAHTALARSSASIIKLFGQGLIGRTGGRGLERGVLTEGAVDVTVTVILAPELLGVTEVCESWQFASEGAPLHARLTAWLNPPRLVSLRVYVAVPPGETVAEDEEPVGTARLKS
jgi:hypothetical protein